MEQLPSRTDKINEIVGRLLSKESHLSYSSLTQFKDSPKAFIDYKLKSYEQTDAMIYGAMVHCLILEPAEFENRYYVLDDAEIIMEIGGAKPRATTAYKQWKLEEVIKSDGKIVVSSDDYTSAKIQSLNVRHNYAAKLVMNKVIETEKKIEWEDKNFLFKGVIDGFGSVIVDLKSCADASPRKFQRDIVSMDYHLQAALYLKGIGKNLPYYIIAFDKSNGVSVHQLTETLLTHAMKEVDTLLDQFNKCILEDGFNKSYDFYSERFDGAYYCDKPAYLY